MRSLIPLLLCPTWSTLVAALKLDITGRSVTHLKTLGGNILAKEDHSDEISSTQDVLYIANVTIDGIVYPLQMDTGSSDLWVDLGGNSPSNPTSTMYNLTYGTGYAYGPIAHGPVSFAGYDIPDQAFLVFQSGNNPVMHFGAVGIVGLGFTGLSHIDAATDADWGRSLLYNIFAQNPSEPNFIAMALERESDAVNTVQGSLGVGELAEEYKSISETEHIPLFPPEDSKRWTVLLDSYAVNGANQNVTSVVEDVPAGRVVVLLDSGTTYSYAPPAVAESIYSSVPGALLNTTTNQWSVPCSAGIRLTLWIAGRPFDIHPLDIVTPSLSDPSVCIGSFIPYRIAVGSTEFDWIFGANVLRSVYAVYDFGDFDSNNVMGNPYVQLLSVVDIEQAASDFQSSRGGTVNIDNGNGVASASVSVMTTSQKMDKLLDLIPMMFAVLGANALILLTLLIIAIWLCCHFRKQKNRKARVAPLPLTTVATSSHAYEAVPTGEHERPSSAHTRRSSRALTRSASKQSFSSRSVKEEGAMLMEHPNMSRTSILRPSITINRDDDTASIRSGRVPVGGDASRRSSRLTPPRENSPSGTPHRRVPSNLAPAPASPSSASFTTPPIASPSPPQEEGLVDVSLQAHNEEVEAELKGDLANGKKRYTFRPPPPITAPGYRKSMHSDMSATTTVAGSEAHFSGNMASGGRATSQYLEQPPRQSSLNSEVVPSPTESSYQDARQSYYSVANDSPSNFPRETPTTGRSSMMVHPAPEPVPTIHEEAPSSSQQDPRIQQQERQRAAFMAALNEPLAPPRRPRVPGGGEGLGVHQDPQSRMSAYHTRSPSQE
ncbi:hypothetical protein FRC14_001801, partial [Serendipita sp. 396]